MHMGLHQSELHYHTHNTSCNKFTHGYSAVPFELFLIQFAVKHKY